MASNDDQGNEGGPRRSGRKRDPSGKARRSLEDGEKIPGLDQPLALPSCSPPQQQRKGPMRPAAAPKRDVKGRFCQPHQPSRLTTAGLGESTKRFDKTAQVSAVILTSTIHGPVPTRIQASTKMRTRKKSRPSRIVGPDNTTNPAHAATTFMLAGWPRTPTKTPEEIQAQWAAKRGDQATTTDVIETYFEDDADDWEEFAGNPARYPKPGDLEKAIGSAFVNRAKYAFRMSKSWERFEFEEEAIDSMRPARCEQNTQRRKALLAECLDNDLRLRVFEQLKERLCRNIWHERYEPVAKEEQSAPAVREKKDSKVSTVSWNPEDEPEDEEHEDEKEEEQAPELDEYSVVGWDSRVSGRYAIWHRPNGQAGDD